MFNFQVMSREQKDVQFEDETQIVFFVGRRIRIEIFFCLFLGELRRWRKIGNFNEISIWETLT